MNGAEMPDASRAERAPRTGKARIRPSRPDHDEKASYASIWVSGGERRVLVFTLRGFVCGITNQCVTAEAARAWAERRGITNISVVEDGPGIAALNIRWEALVKPPAVKQPSGDYHGHQ